MRKIVIIALSVLICINIVGCNKTVAKVNDVQITKDEYEKVASLLYITGYMEKNNGKIDDDILSLIIDNEVAYQDAKKQGIKVENREVEGKFEDLKSTVANNISYKEKLESSGINEDFLKSQVEKDLIVSKYKENFIKDIKISDDEIKLYYENHKDEFIVDEVRASQILISTLDENNNEVSKEEKEKRKVKAQTILDKINNNENFDILAKENSDDKKSGNNGGDLGYFSKNDKNVEFTKAVFKLEKNQVSNLIETSYGYHIVKVTDKRTSTKTLEDSKDDIKNKILNQKYSDHIDSLYKNGKIIIT